MDREGSSNHRKATQPGKASNKTKVPAVSVYQVDAELWEVRLAGNDRLVKQIFRSYDGRRFALAWARRNGYRIAQ